MDKQKLVNILGAGTVTGLILIIMLAFGGGWAGGTAVDSASAASDPNANVQVVPLDSYTNLEQENAQLQEALDTMVDREAQYQTQIEEANQLLNEAAVPVYEEEDDDEYEEEDYDEDSEDYEDGDSEDYEDEDSEEDEEDDDDYEDGDDEEDEEEDDYEDEDDDEEDDD